MLIEDQYLLYALRSIFCVSIERDNVIYCMSINGFPGCLEILTGETPGNSDDGIYEGRYAVLLQNI